jgi:MYXO-CTERM domain-containing protein
MSLLLLLSWNAWALEPACTVSWDAWDADMSSPPDAVTLRDGEVLVTDGSSAAWMLGLGNCALVPDAPMGVWDGGPVFGYDPLTYEVIAYERATDWQPEVVRAPPIDGDVWRPASAFDVVDDTVFLTSRLGLEDPRGRVMRDVLSWRGSPAAWTSTHLEGPEYNTTAQSSGGVWVRLTGEGLHHEVDGVWVEEALPSTVSWGDVVSHAETLMTATIRTPARVSEVHAWTWEAGAWSDEHVLPLPAWIDQNWEGRAVATDGRTIVATYYGPAGSAGGEVFSRTAVLIWREFLDGWRVIETLDAPRVSDGFATYLDVEGYELVVLTTSEGREATAAGGTPSAVARYLLPAIDADGDGESELTDPDDMDPLITSDTPAVDTDVSPGETAEVVEDEPQDTDLPAKASTCSCGQGGTAPGGWLVAGLGLLVGLRRRVT